MAKTSGLTLITKALWQYSAGRRALLVSYYLLEIALNLTGLLTPYLLGQIINTLQTQGKEGIHDALLLVAALAATEVFLTGINQISNWIQMWFNHKLRETILKNLYGKVQALPLLWHQEHHSANVISRMNATTGALSSFIYLPQQFINISISLLGPAFILIGISPTIGTAALFMTIAAAAVTYYFEKRIKHFSQLTRDLYHTLYATINDYVTNIRTIVTLHLGQQTLNDIHERMLQTDAPERREINWRVSRNVTTGTMVNLISLGAITYAILSFQDVSNTLLIGDLVMVINYVSRMSYAANSSTRFLEDYTQNVVSYEGFDFIEDAYNKHVAKAKPNEILPGTWQSIAIRNLCFSYASDSIALDNVSFKLERGRKIALVGSSGAGKSTLMSVLRGLYPAQDGSVVIDGKEFDTVETLASISTLIPQDPEIFENTIRYNITLGVEHSDDEILEACRIACFDTVLADLPNGLDSKINEKGVNLSGGQKQRLALARGIFAIRESSLVLFDEPTSSVDSLTERLMYQNLFTAFPDICLISSIHRLNLLNQFDTIWVMEKGWLVQQGSLEELTRTQEGIFHQLWSAYQQESRN